MEDKKRCPECGVLIAHIRFRASYSEYGTAYGDRWPNGEEDISDTNCNDSDYDNYEYSCPECTASLCYNFFEKEDEPEENFRIKQLIKLVV